MTSTSLELKALSRESIASLNRDSSSSEPVAIDLPIELRAVRCINRARSVQVIGFISVIFSYLLAYYLGLVTDIKLFGCFPVESI